MAAGDENAVHAEFARDLGVVKGVANEEDFAGREREVAEELAALPEFGGAVEVAGAADVGEEGGEVVGVKRFEEQGMVEGGKDGLGKADGGATRERGAGVGEERGGFGVEIGVVGFGDGLPLARREVRGEAATRVVAAHGEAEMREVAGARDGREAVVGEEAVEGVEGGVHVVEEGSVPVPDDMPGVNVHGSRVAGWGFRRARRMPGSRRDLD